MSCARVLVVEDEPHLAAGIQENLRAEGHAVEVAGDGERALARWGQGGIDLLVLDVMLPRRDGYAVCRAIRAAGDAVPILFLTAKNAGEDRVRGLEAGGDDYLGKPFHLRELLLRVRGLLQRAAGVPAAPASALARSGRARPPAPPSLTLASFQIDPSRAEVTDAEGRVEPLPRRDMRILTLLLAAEGEVLTRDHLLAAAWGDEVYPSSRVLDAIVARLRARFEPDPAQPRLFHTLPGVGYRLTAQGAPTPAAPGAADPSASPTAPAPASQEPPHE